MPQTPSQVFAQAAFEKIDGRGPMAPDYIAFAKRLPSLIHACGLAQAIAFLDGNKRGDLLADLAHVMHKESPETLKTDARQADLLAYIRLSRQALEAAGWIKRYVEALSEEVD